MLTLLAIAAIVLIGSLVLFIFLGWRLDVHDRTAFEATLTPVEAARLRGFRVSSPWWHLHLFDIEHERQAVDRGRRF